MKVHSQWRVTHAKYYCLFPFDDLARGGWIVHTLVFDALVVVDDDLGGKGEGGGV